jgi:hypothetical protein
MRWERLFDDLEARLAAEEDVALDAEVADRTRRERALVGLHERLGASRHTGSLVVSIAGLGAVTAAVADVGADWVLLTLTGDRAALVPFHALRSLGGLGGRVGPASPVARGFPLGAALRAISRDRAVVTVVTLEGVRLVGTVDAVGADALDLAEHAADLPRRAEHVTGHTTVPMTAIGAVLRG